MGIDRNFQEVQLSVNHLRNSLKLLAKLIRIGYRNGYKEEFDSVQSHVQHLVTKHNLLPDMIDTEPPESMCFNLVDWQKDSGYEYRTS